VDSEPIANRVFAEQLGLHGMPMTVEDVVLHFIGSTRDMCIEKAGALRGEPLPATFAQEWDCALQAATAVEVKAIAGIPEVLRSLEIPYCVCSNNELANITVALTAAGLMPLVEGRLFSASQVARPKPAPDLFLHAAKTMGFEPAQTVVVEDTPTGVRAAIAAGMRVFAYVGGGHTDRAEVARLGARVFDDMARLPGLLAGA
jgi:HAD superfamily hydrolase (TIGR01509 family)